MDIVNEAQYEYFRNRGVKYLIHFTPAENLESILEHGICPRQYMEKKDIGYRCTDTVRADGKNGYTSYSVSYPNRAMLLNKKLDDQISFAILYVDISVLKYIESERIIYCKSNAAKNRDWGNGIRYLDAMFCDSITDQNGNDLTRIDLGIPKSYTTDPQAEVLIHCIIPPEYIVRCSLLAITEEDAARIRQKAGPYASRLKMAPDKTVNTENDVVKRWSSVKTA